MLRKDIDSLTDEQLVPLTLVNASDLDKMVLKANSVDPQIEQLKLEQESSLNKLKDQAAIELQTAKDQAAIELQTAKDQAAIELQTAKDQAAVELQTAKDQAAVTLSNMSAGRDKDNEVKDTTIKTLQIQLAGSKGSYQATVTFLHDAALQAETDNPSKWINDYINQGLVELSKKHMGPILQASLAKYPTLPTQMQHQLLVLLNLPQLSKLTVEEQLPILATSGIAAFQALDSEIQNQIIEALNL